MKKKLGARPPSPRPQDLHTNTALPAESLEAQIKSLESSLEKTATENTELEERSNQLSKDKSELTDNLETEKQKRSELQSGAASFAVAIPHPSSGAHDFHAHAHRCPDCCHRVRHQEGGARQDGQGQGNIDKI